MVKVFNSSHNFEQGKITFEFHVSRPARNKYKIDKLFFSITGDLIISNFYQARLLSEKINERKKQDGHYDNMVTPGQINALGLLHEIFHYVIRIYEGKENPKVFSRSLDYLALKLGEKELGGVLKEFINEFPPLSVFKGSITSEEYINAFTKDKPNKEILIEELLLLYIENSNPATRELEELYTDKELSKKSKYIEFLDQTEQFFISEKTLGIDNLPLLQFLRKPIINNPHSIEDQIEYIMTNWKDFIPEKLLERLLRGRDLLREDTKLFIKHGGGEKATPPVPKYRFDEEFFNKLKLKIAAGEKLTEEENQFFYAETEQFTEDTHWMPEVVMIAKNIFVWLDQLSKKYNRPIKQLDQIPDEELDILANWNFTALWLIGVWERCSASQKIKQYTGNPEAAASAYSLYDYVIAKELGGEKAFNNLKNRAWARGIRIASDMVPNHTGIYSKWVIKKPGYFLQTEVPPFPNYSFTGPNLSEDERVQIRIEDKYYSRSDAAVVFERTDMYTGDKKYFYHGNDGTNMPWNDTAQLNLLNPEVREALIQIIMHVARRTPIIRFDAAMTLAKKHYQRLWFPQPGTGGAIPSRSDFSMTRSQFDMHIPVEFWREVVDRINKELPNTLLLAEAFWLMEGYFVRTLGMHRVYNSAFMHMLMKEENNKYRELIKNTLDYNPEILKRYVNFMSNPDEETAVNQFGKGDKYFGVSLLMVTLPGLPMFGHGQIEGLSEKYGMEYKKAYHHEFADDNLIKRHQAEIFPLMKKRHLFSQVNNFEFYDLIDDFGNVNENVFAYSNVSNNERAFIIYNNSYTEAKGTINYSVKKITETSNGDKLFSTKKLSDALDIKPDHKYFYAYKDHKSNLEYIVSGRDMHESGIYLFLGGYQYNIFLNFREIYDTSGNYERLTNFLSGKGVPSVEQAFIELSLKPVHESIYNLMDKNILGSFCNFILHEEKAAKTDMDKLFIIPSKLNDGFYKLIDEINLTQHLPFDKEDITKKLSNDLKSIKSFNIIWRKHTHIKTAPQWVKTAESSLVYKDKKSGRRNFEVLFPLILFNRLFNDGHKADELFNILLLDRVLTNSLERLNHLHNEITSEITLIKILSSNDINLIWDTKSIFSQETKNKPGKNRKGLTKEVVQEESFISKLLNYKNVCDYLDVNEYEGVKYYSKEKLENLLDWLFTLNSIYLLKNLEDKKDTSSIKNKLTDKFKKELLAIIKNSFQFIQRIKEVSVKAGYKVDELKELFILHENETNVLITKNNKRKVKTAAKTKGKNK